MSSFSVRIIVRSLTVWILAIAGGTASGVAQVTASCIAENGRPVKVPIVVAPSAEVARAIYNPRPLILIDPAFLQFSQPAKRLILNHECHHATRPYVNEDEADVYAGKLMYMAGFSEETTVIAAKEVFRSSCETKGHSSSLTRIRSVMRGYSDAEDGLSANANPNRSSSKGIGGLCRCAPDDEKNTETMCP